MSLEISGKALIPHEKIQKLTRMIIFNFVCIFHDFPILSTVFLERLGGLIEELELETIVEAISELEITRPLDCCCSGFTKINKEIWLTESEKYMFLNQRNTYMTILSELEIQCLAATSSPQDILDLCQASSPVGFVVHDSCG